MLQRGDNVACRGDEAGFTLIELIIALALFALIALAGVALVESVLGIEERTSGRLDRLATVQRATYAVQVDLDQIAPGPLMGGGDRLSFRTHGGPTPGIASPLSYALERGILERIGADGNRQKLLPGVKAVQWRFYRSDMGWIDRWPPSASAAGIWPEAVALELSLAAGQGVGGTLRRVVMLPDQP